MESYRDVKHWDWGQLRFPTSGFVWSCLLLTTIFRQASADLANETAVLLSIKRTWGNPLELSSWSSSVNTCSSWLYVTCDSRNTTIIRLNLYIGNVKSSLPESIAELVDLEELTMQEWGLTGVIPSSIGRLTSLTNLDFSGNVLSGSIPSAIGNLTTLTGLDLSSNNLTGGLPVELSNLRLLTQLNLETNMLTRNIPSWIGNFSKISVMNLGNNRFTGSIPLELGNLTNLVNLTMTSCGVSGNLPSNLGSLSSVANMNLNGNNFGGSIPDSFTGLKNLISLEINQCNLNGVIPSSIGSLTSLNFLDLSQNNLAGPIPATFVSLVSLQSLFLFQNSLNGTIPQQINMLSSLVSLDLHQNSLAGPIPTQLLQLSSLVILDLSWNFLTGEISQNLATLPNLFELSLNNNCLNGTIPTYNKSNTNLQFNFGDDTNCFNGTQFCKCAAALPSQAPLSPALPPFISSGGETGSSNTAQHVYIAVGVIAGTILALVALLLLFFFRSKRRTKLLGASTTYRGHVRQYALAEVMAATNNLTTKVGAGGYATVYKAVFKDGTIAAVKHFNKKTRVESFESEVDLLSTLNHRYLVNLIGYCEEAGELMLLYDFMDRGNLFENLHGARSNVPLTWAERVRVVLNVARGIEYLHYGTNPPMIHRDIKPANILLASQGCTFNVKLADFGLGKQTALELDEMTAEPGNEPVQPSTTRVLGTRGYIDPEYATMSALSKKSDVYSYGVVLLELITGKPSIITTEKDIITLVSWAKPYLDQDDIWKIVDPKLGKGTFPEEQLVAVATLASSCVEHESRYRPTIRDVLKILTEIFQRETMQMGPSLGIKSTGEFSSSHSTEFILNKLNELIGNRSMEHTQSEILPRD